MTKPNGSAQTPHEFFSALFDEVLEEMERNPDFAARLSERMAQKLGGAVTVKVEGKKRPAATVPPALEEMDLKAALEALGQIPLREKLGRFTNAQLGALVRARKWSEEPVSKMNKGQLLNAIIRAVK